MLWGKGDVLGVRRGEVIGEGCEGGEGVKSEGKGGEGVRGGEVKV